MGGNRAMRGKDFRSPAEAVVGRGLALRWEDLPRRAHRTGEIVEYHSQFNNCAAWRGLRRPTASRQRMWRFGHKRFCKASGRNVPVRRQFRIYDHPVFRRFPRFIRQFSFLGCKMYEKWDVARISAGLNGIFSAISRVFGHKLLQGCIVRRQRSGTAQSRRSWSHFIPVSRAKSRLVCDT